MKKKAIGVWILLLALTGVAFAADFREVDWEMSKKQVIKAEKANKVALEKYEYYTDKIECLGRKVTIAGIDCTLFYFFVNDRLKQGEYEFSCATQDPEKLIEQFRQIDKLMVEKYGKPAESEDVIEEEFKGTLPQALKRDQGYLYSEWKLAGNNLILHELHFDEEDGEIVHFINYYTQENSDLLDRIDELGRGQEQL